MIGMNISVLHKIAISFTIRIISCKIPLCLYYNESIRLLLSLSTKWCLRSTIWKTIKRTKTKSFLSNLLSFWSTIGHRHGRSGSIIRMSTIKDLIIYLPYFLLLMDDEKENECPKRIHYETMLDVLEWIEGRQFFDGFILLIF